MPDSGEAPWRHGAFPGRPLFIYFPLCKDNNVVIRNLAKTVKVGDNNAANQEYGGFDFSEQMLDDNILLNFSSH